jgi:hypothetical protein
MPTKKQKPRPEKKAAGLVQVRIYKNDHGVLKRIAMRKSIGRVRTMPIAEVIRQLIKGA